MQVHMLFTDFFISDSFTSAEFGISSWLELAVCWAALAVVTSRVLTVGALCSPKPFSVVSLAAILSPAAAVVTSATLLNVWAQSSYKINLSSKGIT